MLVLKADPYADVLRSAAALGDDRVGLVGVRVG